MHCLMVRDIQWCEADGNYVRLHFTSGTFNVRVTMTALAARLPTEFVRVNRSSVVNMHYIKELRTTPSGDYDVVLQDGTSRPLTRGHRRSFMDAFIVV
jgi:two-component system LytT family response regulator